MLGPVIESNEGKYQGCCSDGSSRRCAVRDGGLHWLRFAAYGGVNVKRSLLTLLRQHFHFEEKLLEIRGQIYGNVHCSTKAVKGSCYG